MASLHIHLDESGNFDFSPRGTRYYIFTTAWTYEPLPLAHELTALRFSLIKAGHNSETLSCFHACDDPLRIRERVIDMLLTRKTWWFASIVVDKCRVNPSIREPLKFYPKFLSMLLKFVLRGRVRTDTSQVLIYTDTLPLRTKQETAAALIAIKSSCQNDMRRKIPFQVCNHRRESNAWLQVADYCSWSVCRKWERTDDSTYLRLGPRLAATEIAPMSRGDGVTYY